MTTTTRSNPKVTTRMEDTSPADAAALPHDCLPETAPDEELRRERGRLAGVDAARGLALLGMFMVHVLPSETPDGDVSWAWAVSSGRSSALFAMLAGIGLAFMTGREHRVTSGTLGKGVRPPLVRGTFIIIIGLALGSAVGPEHLAVILPYLGIMFILAIPLLTMPPGWLLALFVAWSVAGPVVSHWVRRGVESPEATNLTLGQAASAPGDALWMMLVTGVFPAVTWMAYLCLGIGLGRLDLGSRRVAALLTVTGSVLAAGAAGLSALLLGPLGGRDRLADEVMGSWSLEDFTGFLMWGSVGTAPTGSWWWLATAAPHTGTPLDLLHTSGVAMVVLGACLVVAHTFRGSLFILTAPGSMTLTLYTAHALLLPTLAPAGWPPPVELAAHLVVLGGFALLWRRWHGRGPIETLVSWFASGSHRPDQERRGPTAGRAPGSASDG